jgi:hypothetical protein
MAILTYVGVSLLCLGYLGLIFVSLSSKTEQDNKNIKPMRSTAPAGANRSKNQPSNPSGNATPL